MKIKFLKPKLPVGKVKCTVHLSGKLGFSKAAIKELGIDDNSYIKIGINEEESYDTNLYMAILGEENADTFKIKKAGDYHYVNTQHLLDELEVDYKNKKVIYDIESFDYEGTKMYKLTKREIERKQ